VLEKADCEAMGMGLYLGVAEASEAPPKFIHLTYKPAGDVKRKVRLWLDAGLHPRHASVGRKQVALA